MTITGTNDVPDIVADTSGTAGTNVHDLTETDSALTDSGALAVIDADITNTVTATVHGVAVGGTGATSAPSALDNAALMAMLTVDTGNVIDSAHIAGTIHWNFNSAPQAFDFLATGETLEVIYTIRATDSDISAATDDETVVITITGTNDAPVITADPGTHGLTETDAALTTSGTLAVTDADVTNTVAATVHGVAVGGTGATSAPSALDNAALMAMLSVDAGNVIDNASTSGTIHWNFDSAPQAFDFLATGETLQLTYTIRATDSDVSAAHDDQTVVITITGTNDAPVIAAALADSPDEGDPRLCDQSFWIRGHRCRPWRNRDAVGRWPHLLRRRRNALSDAAGRHLARSRRLHPDRRSGGSGVRLSRPWRAVRHHGLL